MLKYSENNWNYHKYESVCDLKNKLINVYICFDNRNIRFEI